VKYSIVLTPDDNGTLLVTCPDLPEVTTFGEDEEDARVRGLDAIEEALAARIAHREEIPVSSAAHGRPVVSLPPLTAAKVELYQATREKGISKAALGRALGLHGPQVDRLLNVRHSSKIEQIDRAFRTMGKHLEITVHDDAA
jgi:antitoxin HicB